MGGAPVIETIRAGVQFTPVAAASFRRLEGRLGRRVDVNSTYRDYAKQLSMYNAWNAYAAGRGPYPGHSRAIHPDYSIHCRGMAMDSDDWTTPGFNALAAEYGWIRTAANDPTERHHFEYQWANDKHRNEPTPAGRAEEDEMSAEIEQMIRDIRTTQLQDSKVFREGTHPAVVTTAQRVASMHAGNFLPWEGTGPGGTLSWLDEKLAATASAITSAILGAIPGSGTVDPVAVRAAVREGVQEALRSIETTVTVKSD